jgi:hypothetical protein
VGLAALLTTPPATAFKPGIHEDISEGAARPIARTVGGETLTFRDKAIVQIRKANSATDLSSDFLRSFKHFDSELFGQASQRLVDLKGSVIGKITASTPSGQKAREDLGTALHTLQDFYAHSNWIETGRGGGINGALGRSTLVNPPAATAFCPGNPEVLSGPGLTGSTSGYYVGLLGCGPLPAGKCYHGGPGGCDGINKDAPGRPNHGPARSLAQQATKDYIDQILDAGGVAGNAKAIKALMGINGTLGMVIDDTGSMGEEIGQVKAQVASIVTSIGVTDEAPDEYLLVRFGDPDVGPPIVTGDPGAFLSSVNSLFPHGGGDCPELSQTALLQAIGASRKDSKLFSFTDASAKDAGLANSVNAAAQAKRIKITHLLTGSCSPIDPVYFANAEETGGQLFLLNQFQGEVGKIFDLVRPQLFEDFVTIRRSRGTLPTLDTRELAAPIDSSVTTAVFSAAIDLKQSVTLRRPSGAPVVPGEPGVTITELTSGAIIAVVNPEPGEWRLAVRGTGDYRTAVQGNSPLDLYIFEFVELTNPAHPGYARIAGQPVVGTTPTGLADLIGPFATAEFHLVDEVGSTLQTVDLAPGDPNAAADQFSGSFALPATPFRVAVSGVDASGQGYERLFPTLFRAQTVKVSLDPDTALPGLPVGVTSTLRYDVLNLGAPATFRITGIDSQRFVTRVQPTLLTLASGATGSVSVDLTVPAGTPDATDVSLTVTATSNSDSGVTNSATTELITLPANGAPDCTAAGGVRVELWPPNHDFVSVDVLAQAGVTDPDGDPVTAVVTAITQDEPVQGNGSGNTAPDGSGVGTAVAAVRAERAGDGNGRVYGISFTASDGRGGSCSASLAVTVPHSQNGSAAIDDGQLHDSTQP